MRSLQDELREYVAAAFPGIWIQSFEHDDALREIVALCKQEKWSLAAWDVDKGLQVGAAAVGTAPDPLAALRALPAMAKEDSPALLVLPNFHRFLGSPEIVQCLANTPQASKTDVPKRISPVTAAYLVDRCLSNGYEESQDHRNLEAGECEDRDCIQLADMEIGDVEDTGTVLTYMEGRGHGGRSEAGAFSWRNTARQQPAIGNAPSDRLPRRRRAMSAVGSKLCSMLHFCGASVGLKVLLRRQL